MCDWKWREEVEEGVWEMDGCALLRTDRNRCKHAI